MFEKGIKCCVWILMLCLVLSVAPAMAGDKSDLAARAATWEKEYNGGNLKGVLALYAADGCRMPPNAPIAQGSDAIMAQLQNGKDHGVAQVKIAVTTDETSGDWGYGTGTFEIMGTDGSHVDHGKWMNVSKKIKGKWMIQCDIFNSDMPMPTAK